MHILGLGLSSLMAYNYLYSKGMDVTLVCDSSEYDKIQRDPAGAHRAVLRFKTNLVSELTGIPMEQITIQKGIVNLTGYNIPSSIEAMNAYSFKVTGALTRRSIMNTEQNARSSCINDSIRYLPPKDFIRRLLSNVKHFKFLDAAIGQTYSSYIEEHIHSTEKQPIISTIPLTMWYNIDNGEKDENTLQGAKSILVTTAKLNGVISNLHQTIYYPFGLIGMPSLYRATMEGDTIIAEFMLGKQTNFLSSDKSINSALVRILETFGIYLNGDGYKLTLTNLTRDAYPRGKLNPLKMDDKQRKALIYNLTNKHRVYSLGRWATYRSIGMDAIANDLLKIERLLRMDDYALKLRNI